MHVGVLTVPLGDQPLESALETLDGLGVDGVELGCGGYPGQDHIDRKQYLDDEEAQSRLRQLVASYDMTIDALATHNNPLHPDEARATEADTELREAIRLASQLDVPTVTTFSGLPAGGPDDSVPNWITAPWPTEHAEAHEYQWTVATDYWHDVAGFAADHGVDIAIEMHPNMLVYEPRGLLELRERTGDRIGANFDPSHLYWQGIDAVEAIHLLGDAIHHVHGKDTAIAERNVREQGVLDTTPYTDEAERSWLFRSIGDGHDLSHWKDVVAALRVVGYDGALSVEHEDSLLSAREGLSRSVETLQAAVFETTPGEAYWAE